MEREVLFTGIGGQSVQLAAQVLAEAAVREDRYVTLLGTYGGSMRGGNTESALIVGDAPIESPPRVAKSWAALAMHHQFWPAIAARLRPGAVVVLNAGLFDGDVDRETHRVFDVPATRVAGSLGNALAASMMLVGAFGGLTGLVGVDALVEAMRDALPAYRQQHAELNEKALRAGWDLLPAGAEPAWEATR